jgi:TPR repeat protein
MSTEDENKAGLVPSQSGALSRSGATSLARRGLSDLCGREYASELWRSGRELASQDKFEEAIACFDRAAVLHPEDVEVQWQFTLALDALHCGSPRNDLAAFNWYRIGAEKGIALAQCRLGAAYCYGLGVDKDYQQAAYWYEKAANQGRSEAQCTLGWLYHCGLGVPKNLSLAIYWYRMAAAQQHETLSQEARIYLGDIYAQGDCVPVNLTQANHWYEQALAYYQHLAEQGWAPAQYSLGLMHERGKGVQHDREKAAYWYRKAADNGYELAKSALANLTPQRIVG